MAIAECRRQRIGRPATFWNGASPLRLLIVVVSVACVMGCGRGYKEKVIAAKEFTPLERAVKMLEGYAAGEPVGSEFMGFELLREELRSHNADPGGVLDNAFGEIEKSMRRPAEVKAIAQRTLAELTKADAQPQ